MNLKNIEEYINDSILDTIYKEREEAIIERSSEDEKEIEKIKEKYPVDHEQLLISINNLPPHFKNIREDLLNKLDMYLMQENLISSYDNEKFYKIGFCDGIRTIIENMNQD